jgi:hypothetical protein
MKDFAIFVACRLLLAAAWLADRLEYRARWISAKASGRAWRLRSAHSAQWLEARETARLRRVVEEG